MTGQVIDAQLEIPGAAPFKRPETQLMVTDPLQMLNKALDSGKDAETLSRFMALYKEWKADLAKEAFEDAMAKFKGETIVLLRDKTNKQYASKYISLGNLVNTVTPFLSKHGLSVNWDQKQPTPGVIEIICTLTHRLGHFKTNSIMLPPDDSGAKNPIQKIKSTVTYGRATTFEGICGLASSDANLDDDGNGAGKAEANRPAMDPNEKEERLNHFPRCQSYQEIDAHYKTSFAVAHEAKDQDAKDAFIAAKKTAYARLREKQ